MKRCPQCEFIYEDEQSLCDMDGVLLVFDSRTLPNPHALATVPAPVLEKARRRNRMAPAFATLILMLVMGSVYYVSTTRNAASSEYSPASTPTEAPAAVPPAPAANQPPASTTTPGGTEARETQPAARETQPAPAKKSTTTKPRVVKPEEKKDDSKVGSILKKTGKILKKPFKF